MQWPFYNEYIYIYTEDTTTQDESLAGTYTNLLNFITLVIKAKW